MHTERSVQKTLTHIDDYPIYTTKSTLFSLSLSTSRHVPSIQSHWLTIFMHEFKVSAIEQDRGKKSVRAREKHGVNRRENMTQAEKNGTLHRKYCYILTRSNTDAHTHYTHSERERDRENNTIHTCSNKTFTLTINYSEKKEENMKHMSLMQCQMMNLIPFMSNHGNSKCGRKIWKHTHTHKPISGSWKAQRANRRGGIVKEEEGDLKEVEVSVNETYVWLAIDSKRVRLIMYICY